jgi:heme A synthase
MMIIPIVALLLLISSFFAKVPRGALWALGVLMLVVLQITLGLAGHSVPFMGALHGVNALLLFSTALWTAMRVSRSVTPPTPASERSDRVAV